MINTRKLLIMLLFSFVLISSISVICAADSDASDVQAVGGENVELEQGDSNAIDVQGVDEVKELKEADSNQDVSSKGNDPSDVDDSLNADEGKKNTEIHADNITTFPEEGQIVAKLTDEDGNPLEGCNITLEVNNTHVIRNFVTNESGEVYFNVSGFNLGEGNYTGILKFNGNDDYNASSLLINITLRTLGSNITVNNLTFIYGESGILTICLKDSEGNPINNATIRMDVEVSWVHESLTTNATGEATIDLKDRLDVGRYKGNFNFDRTNGYNASSAVIDIVVNKVPTEVIADNMTCNYGDDEYFVVTLKDKYGNLIANETVTVKFNTNILTGKTDDNGQARFLVDFAPKVYTTTVSFAGNKTHEQSSIIVSIVVNDIREKISINSYNFKSVYNEGKYIIVTLKDDYGKPVTGKQFVVNLNGKTKTYKTDSKGQIKVPISSLLPKTYKVKITFLGDKKYKPIAFDVSLVVKKANPYLFASKKKFNLKTAVKKYKVTLKTNKNAPMKKVKISLKVKGKTYKVKTNKKGQAIFKLKGLNKKGSYKAVITYNGNNCYNKVVKKAKIRVW